MKKVIKITLVILVAFFLWFLFKKLPDIYLNSGEKAYVSGNYPEAYVDLKQALVYNRRNITARRYYAKTLIHLKPTLEVQKELFEISQENLHDSAELTADIQIQQWRNTILHNVGKNYIQQVPFNNKILRWDIKKFPLKICIKNDSSVAPDYYVSQIQNAFKHWQYSSRFIKIKFINDEKSADIVVKVESSDKIPKCEGADCKYTVAYTTPEINDNLLKKMNIYFYDTNNLNNPFSEKEVYNTALHEIGHALGIMGHSYSSNDVMYMESAPDKFQFSNGYALISQADINTLYLLYRLIPDITNTGLDKYNTKYQFFAPIVMGNEEQINTQKVQEALNYVKMAPNLPNGYIDLAAGYAENKQYVSAINSLNQALSVSSNDSEKFIIYYNFSVLYKEIKDFENALKYAQFAEQINPTSDVEGQIASIYFNKGDTELAKQAYKKAIEKDSQNIINSLNYAIIYLREYNFVQAGKIIKTLIAANPEAKNDSRVKKYLVFTYLAF